MAGKMYVTGDCHGEEARFEYKGYAYNRDLTSGDFLFCLGDFGYLEKEEFLDYIANSIPYTIAFLDGNHERFDLINNCSEELWNGGRVHILRRNNRNEPRIIHLMRGETYVINEKRFFVLGGGVSLDRRFRTPGVDWFPEEMPTDEDFANANKSLDECNYEVDYILTHATPVSILYRLHMSINEDEKRLNNYLEYLKEKVNYRHWYMGHLHKEEYNILGNHSVLWYGIADMITGEMKYEEI